LIATLKTRLEDWDKRLAENHPKFRPWFWFVALWCFGFLALTVIASFIKGIFFIGGASV